MIIFSQGTFFASLINNSHFVIVVACYMYRGACLHLSVPSFVIKHHICLARADNYNKYCFAYNS